MEKAQSVLSSSRLSAREADLLKESQSILDNIAERMTAIVRAAATRWKPDTTVESVNETDGPVMGDEEFADICHAVDIVAESVQFRAIASFLGLPEHIVDKVLVDRLTTHLVAPSPNRNAAPVTYVSHRKNRQ